MAEGQNLNNYNTGLTRGMAHYYIIKVNFNNVNYIFLQKRMFMKNS